MTGGAAVAIPRLVMKSAQAGAEQVLSGGKGTETIGCWEWLQSLKKRQLYCESQVLHFIVLCSALRNEGRACLH